MARIILIRLFTVLALIVHQGCAHTGPILSDSTQEEMGRIGVMVIPSGQEESFEDSRTGWFSSMGKGAGSGSRLGGAGVICGPVGGMVCIPVLAAAGAVGGSVYGLYQASSETLPLDVESTLERAVTDAGLAQLLVRDLIAEAQAQGYAMEAARNAPFATGKNQEEESQALQEPYDTLLEIEGPVVNLLPTTFEVDPPRRVGLSARVRVIRTADQEVLDDRIVLDELGDIGPLEEWTGYQARHFREELPRASRRLSEKILIDYFMRYDFEERTFAPGMGAFFDAYLEYRVKGLRDLRPLGARKPLESLRPTMRWETFPGEKVTYDLRIWELKELSTGGFREDMKMLHIASKVGEVVYKSEGLTESEHTLETSLSPSTTYAWSVRARFVQDGKVRVTEWSKASKGFTVWAKISSFGVLALAELAIGRRLGFLSNPHPSFYQTSEIPPSPRIDDHISL